jgi:hypothetical protein
LSSEAPSNTRSTNHGTTSKAQSNFPVLKKREPLQKDKKNYQIYRDNEWFEISKAGRKLIKFQPKSDETNARKICLQISDAESPAPKFRFTKEITSSSDVVKFINRLEGKSLSQFNLLVENIQNTHSNSHLEPYAVHRKIFFEKAYSDLLK